MLRPLIALACLAALAVTSGCGQTDQEKAREVVQDYVDARNAGDFEKVCELFSDSFKQELQTGDCPAFVAEQSSGGEGDEELSLVEVRAKGDVATADIDVTRDSQSPSRIGVRLERQDGEWRISSVQ
jgi:ketosteroid isomerase-like protein